MLEFLKEILGDGYTAEIDQKISAEIGKRFVGRDDYNSKNEATKALKAQLDEATKTIQEMQEQGKDIEAVRKSAQEWEEKYKAAQKEAEQKVAEVQFQSILDRAIGRARGRNTKAIAALLDMEELKSSKNQEHDVEAALSALKEENGYLFEEEETPPSIATGTGSVQANGGNADEAALRAAFGLPNE